MCCDAIYQLETIVTGFSIIGISALVGLGVSLMLMDREVRFWLVRLWRKVRVPHRSEGKQL